MLPQKALAKMQTDLESQLGVMQKEYQTKGQEYVALVKQANVTDAIRQAKEADIQSLQERISNFPDTSSGKIFRKKKVSSFSQSLRKPVKQSAMLPRNKECFMFFEISSVLYFNAAQSTDMMPFG